MKKVLFGILIGFIITLSTVVLVAPGQMVSEKQSPLGYEETIAYIQSNVTNSGWKISAVMRLDKTLSKEGKSVLPVASLKICQPDYALESYSSGEINHRGHDLRIGSCL